MIEYTCETCYKIFSQKGHYEDHKNRKRPCKKNNIIDILIEKKVQEVMSKTNEGVVKIDSKILTINKSNQMDYSTKTREELVVICREKKIKGYSGKKKEDICKLLSDSQEKNELIISANTENVVQITSLKQNLQVYFFILYHKYKKYISNNKHYIHNNYIDLRMQVFINYIFN